MIRDGIPRAGGNRDLWHHMEHAPAHGMLPVGGAFFVMAFRFRVPFPVFNVSGAMPLKDLWKGRPAFVRDRRSAATIPDPVLKMSRAEPA